MLTLTLNRELRTPLQLQTFQFYFRAIQRRDLLCGDKLPSIREQTQVLSVAKIVVVMAYNKLMTAGLIESRHGIGYEMIFITPVHITPALVPVTQDFPPTRPKAAGASTDIYAEPGRGCYCWMGVPDPNAFPWSSWRKWNSAPGILKKQLFIRYHSPGGLFSLRKQLVRYLNLSRGINTRAGSITITSRVQEGLSLLSQIFIIHHTISQQKKRHIVIEPPCYSGAWHLFSYYGADITSIAIDSHGLQTDNLPKYETQLYYVTPAHQYPMGSILSLERHQSLLAWAQRVGAYTIEDDYDAVFTYEEDPLSALKTVDYHNRVIHMGAFSKTLGPGTWLGYFICPDELFPAVQNMETLSNNDSQWSFQQFLTELMQNRVSYTHLSKLACNYTTRLALLRDGLSTLFPEGKIAGATAGLHLSLRIARYTESIARLQ